MAAPKGTKNLVAEFFKFQQKDEAKMHLDGYEMLLNTADKIKINLAIFCLHLSNMKKVD